MARTVCECGLAKIYHEHPMGRPLAYDASKCFDGKVCSGYRPRAEARVGEEAAVCDDNAENWVSGQSSRDLSATAEEIRAKKRTPQGAGKEQA